MLFVIRLFSSYFSSSSSSTSNVFLWICFEHSSKMCELCMQQNLMHRHRQMIHCFYCRLQNSTSSSEWLEQHHKSETIVCCLRFDFSVKFQFEKCHFYLILTHTRTQTYPLSTANSINLISAPSTIIEAKRFFLLPADDGNDDGLCCIQQFTFYEFFTLYCTVCIGIFY